MEDHTAYLDAWVFVAIGGARPEHSDRLLLHEVLSSADYFNRALISKTELEHGVRDLIAGGLATVEGNTFALTPAGRALFDSVWREYESWRDTRGPIAWIRRLLTFQLAEDPISVAERRFRGLAYAAHKDAWSVTKEDFDSAEARYREEFAAWRARNL